MTRGVITIGGRNSPFAISLMLVCVFAGIVGLAGRYRGAPLPFSVFDLRVWYLGLIVGAGLSLVGMAWRDQITGMLIERVGQFILAVLMIAYSVGLLLLSKGAAATPAISTATLAMACVARVVQIHMVTRRIRAAVKAIDGLTS